MNDKFFLGRYRSQWLVNVYLPFLPPTSLVPLSFIEIGRALFLFLSLSMRYLFYRIRPLNLGVFFLLFLHK